MWLLRFTFHIPLVFELLWQYNYVREYANLSVRVLPSGSGYGYSSGKGRFGIGLNMIILQILVVGQKLVQFSHGLACNSGNKNAE